MDFEQDPNPYAAPTDVGSISSLGTTETLRRVASGLNLVYWGIGIVLLAILVGIIGGALTAVLGKAAVLIVAILPAGVIVGTIVGFVGRLFCLAVPPQTGAQGLIYGAVVCDVVAVALALGQFVTESTLVQGASNLLSLTATILFILFLKRVSQFVGRMDLAAKAKSLLVLGITLFAVAFGGALLAVAAPPLLILVGLAILVLALVLLAQYLGLLRDLRLAILAQT
jgi:hypothetical protein